MDSSQDPKAVNEEAQQTVRKKRLPAKTVYQLNVK